MDAHESGPTNFFSVYLPRKSFLLLEPSGSLIPALSAVDALKEEWSFLPVHSIDALKKKLRSDNALVGLIFLPEALTESIFRDLLSLPSSSANPCRWIALVSPAALGNPYVLRLIDELCYDFHLLPVDAKRLKTVMGRAHGMARIGILNEGESRGGETRTDLSLIGSSLAMQEPLRKIRKVAPIEAPVLITGEAGTGKKLAGRAIHERSERRTGPFVVLDCRLFLKNQNRSELFDHGKGVAEAARRKTAPVEAAQGGTILLDAIENLPPDLQAGLLRMVETGKIGRPGSPPEIPVDVRLIAATSVDLENLCREGRFLEDLFRRLSLLEINIPPLREREGDIIDLALHFLRKFSADRPRPRQGFTPEALRELLRHRWPGNVCELASRIRRAVPMSDAPFIHPEELGLDPPGNGRSLAGCPCDARPAPRNP